MIAETSPVKEREDADCCRYCGRPTWSLRRCCVRCKRHGRSGTGAFASWHVADAPRLPALAGYWLGHLATMSLLAVVILMYGDVGPGHIDSLLQIGLFESTVSTFGFAIALAFSPRPPRAAGRAFVTLAVVTGMICAVVVHTALFLFLKLVDEPVSPGYLIVLVVLLSANVSRVVLGVGLTGESIDIESHSGDEAAVDDRNAHPPNAP